MKVIIMLCFSLLILSCKDQLDIKNPNEPSIESARTENGIISLAQGGIYVNGFINIKYNDSNSGFFWTGAVAFHELMGDIIGEEFNNVYGNQIGCPDLVILDDGTQVPNPQNPPKQKDLIRQVNLNAEKGNNPLYYEWAYMYAMNNACNVVLSNLGLVAFKGDTATKANLLRTWCYFWKGYAYSRIGSMYYAGIINNVPFKTNGHYVSKEEILAEAETNFANAESALDKTNDNTDYDQVLGSLIPSICQTGTGGILTPEMWKRNMNTLRARNVLVNNPVPDMSKEKWEQVLNLASDGIQSSDYIFTLRSNATGDLMNSFGNIPSRTFGPPALGNTFKVSERLIQEFYSGDQRLANNFEPSNVWVGNSGWGNSFNTSWALLDGGNGIPGVVVMCNVADGEDELYLAGSYVENELMKAEADIYLSSVEQGLQIIDKIRQLQGAGLPAVSGQSMTQEDAIKELRRERRVAMAFRGFGFYDARRWGIIKNGRTGAYVIDNSGNLNTNATIKYNFLDYWDVPDNELVYNPPLPGSADVKNPDGL